MNKPSNVSQWLVWVALLLMLVVLGMLRSAANGGWLEEWLGEHFLRGARLILGLFAALVVAWIALREVRQETERADPSLDRAFLLLVLSWVFSSAVVLVQETLPESAETTAVRHIAYQLSVLATLGFLRKAAQVPTAEARPVILGQLVMGMGMILWRYASPGHAAWALEAWRLTNVLGFSLVFLLICRTQLTRLGQPRWLSLGACLMGFGMGMNDMSVADGVSLNVTGMHNVFSAYLLLVWLMLTNRISHLSAPRQRATMPSENSVLGGAFANSYLNGAQPEDPEEAPEDLAHAKRRFAQELHDGVGSQLVNILASLDRGVPQQREMALAVEHCLLDVKILVDDIDGGQEGVLDALARLRYRVQASLQRLGIALDWDMHDHPALEQLRDERSRQVLRIVQEAVANVMRHSRAKNVRVSCLFRPEAHAVLVTVVDDGQGFDAKGAEQRMGGKGLLGMRRRANSMGASLEVLSEPGKGTRVSLMLPLGERAPLMAVHARASTQAANSSGRAGHRTPPRQA